MPMMDFISDNSSFRQKNPGVRDSSDGSDSTSYTLMENYTFPVALAMRRVVYILLPEFTGLMKWPSGAPGRTWEHVESL